MCPGTPSLGVLVPFRTDVFPPPGLTLPLVDSLGVKAAPARARCHASLLYQHLYRGRLFARAACELPRVVARPRRALFLLVVGNPV